MFLFSINFSLMRVGRSSHNIKKKRVPKESASLGKTWMYAFSFCLGFCLSFNPNALEMIYKLQIQKLRKSLCLAFGNHWECELSLLSHTLVCSFQTVYAIFFLLPKRSFGWELVKGISHWDGQRYFTQIICAIYLSSAQEGNLGFKRTGEYHRELVTQSGFATSHYPNFTEDCIGPEHKESQWFRLTKCKAQVLKHGSRVRSLSLLFFFFFFDPLTIQCVLMTINKVRRSSSWGNSEVYWLKLWIIIRPRKKGASPSDLVHLHA